MRMFLLDVKSFEAEDQAAVRFFLTNLCKVEIARNSELHRVFFPRPILTNFLTEKTKDETLWNLPRDSPGEKVRVCLCVCTTNMVCCLHMASNKSVREKDWRSRKRATQAARVPHPSRARHAS
jgi:hypothetical protein